MKRWNYFTIIFLFMGCTAVDNLSRIPSSDLYCSEDGLLTKGRFSYEGAGCRSKIGVVYKLEDQGQTGRCVTENSISLLKKHDVDFNHIYEICVKEYEGRIGGTVIAGVEEVGKILGKIPKEKKIFGGFE